MAEKNKNTSKPSEIKVSGEGIVSVNKSIEKTYDAHIKKQKEIIAGMAKQLNYAKELNKNLLEQQKTGVALNDAQQKQLTDAQRLIDVNKKQRDNLKELKKLEEERFKKGIGNLSEYETALRSIGNKIGKNSDLFETTNAVLDSQKISLKSIDKFVTSIGNGNKKLTGQASSAADAYKDMFVSIADTHKGIKTGKKDLDDYNESVIESAEAFDKVIDGIDTSTKSGKKLVQILQGMKGEMDGLKNSAEKSKKQLAAMDEALSQFGSSGIPLANEMSTVIEKVAKGGKGSALAFTALGAAAGAMFSKVIPGLAQMNAKLQAGNDIIQEQIELKRRLAEITSEATFIPEKIELERLQNSYEGQMQINKLAVEGGFATNNIAQERLQNEVETANSINRAMVDAQYAAQRAADSFRASMLSGAAQFRSAAKTAGQGGEQLGNVGYNVSQLQLAGISAEQIAGAMNETSALLGNMPAPDVAASMSVFAKMSGAAETDIAQIADTMNLIEGSSLETSLNLQAGIKQMAKRTGLSFSNLMKGISASSKKMLEYGILNTKQLAKQVAFAQSMGADFNQIADSGRNMVLNYKDSIKGEMKLSAILGRSVDFSEARQLFFEGKQDEAIEAIKAQGLTAEELRSPFAQEALKEASGGMDMDSILKIMGRTGKDAGELQAASITDGNNKFLKRFQKAQQQLSAEEAVISANQAIIDAKLSGKITDAYLKSPGYLEYQNSLNRLAQQQAALSTEITDAWLNSSANRDYQNNLVYLSKEQAKLDGAIQKAFMSSKAYTDYLVDQEKLGLRRQLTENLVPTLGAIGGGALFNIIGNKMFGGGGGGLMSMFGGGGGTNGTTGGTTDGTTSMFSKAAPGGSVAFGNVAGAGMRSNIGSALKSGGAITGGVISGLTSGFMEFSENKKLGISMGENVGRTTTKAISSGVGGWGGASLGAAIGTAIFPGVGTLVGGFLGGWLGGKGGDKLGEAINTGIYGNKQEQIKRTQEEQLQAQNNLQKEMSLNRQVDVNYYKKTLQLDEQQIAQLQKYNQTQAITPDWYKEGPGWLNNLKPGQTASQTYLGSGLPLMPGTQQGDESSPFGRKLEKYFDAASGKFTYEIKEVTEKEYAKFYEQATGKKFTKSVAEQAKKEATAAGGKIKVTEGSQLDKAFAASFGKSDADIYTEYIKEQQKIESEKNRKLQQADKKTLTKDQLVKREQLDKESTASIEKSLKDFSNANKNDPYRNMDISPGMREQMNRRFDFNPKPKTETSFGTGKTTGEAKALGFDAKTTTLDPKNQSTAVEAGTSATMKQYNEPGVLQVRDHNIKDLGVHTMLSLIQSQAHSRGINLSNEIKSAATAITDKIKTTSSNTWENVKASAIIKGLTEVKEGVVGALNRLLVFTVASKDSISKDAQRIINEAAGKGLRGVSSFVPFPAYANGTKSALGGMAMVGENGPELMYVPHSASIAPAGDTKRIQSGDVSKLEKWGMPGYEKGKGAAGGAHGTTTAGHGGGHHDSGGHHNSGGHHDNGLHNFNYLGAINTILSGFGPLALGHFGAHPFKHEATTKLQKENQSHNEVFAAMEMLRLLNPIKHGKIALGNMELLHKAHNWYKTYKDTKIAFELGKMLSVGSGMSKLRYTLSAAGQIAPQYAKYLGKGLLGEIASVPVAVLGTLYSLQSASTMLDNTNISSSGKNVSNERKTGNFVMGVGAGMYDVINDWVTVGLLDKNIGQKTGLTYPGANGTETASLRAMFFNSNPERKAKLDKLLESFTGIESTLIGQSYVDNDELTAWVMANSEYVKSNLGADIFGLVNTYAKEHNIDGKKYAAKAKTDKVKAAKAKKKRVEAVKKADVSQQKAFTFNTTHLDQPGLNLNAKYEQMFALQNRKKVTPTKKYAKGTKGATGGMAMVGENGPELMYVPDNASIAPAGDTKRIQSGDVSKLSKWGIPGYEKGKGGKHGTTTATAGHGTTTATAGHGTTAGHGDGHGTTAGHGDGHGGGHHTDWVGWFNTLASGGGLLPLIHLIGHHAAETDTDKQHELISKFLQVREMGSLIYGGHHGAKWFGHFIEKAENLKQIWTIGKHFLGNGGVLKYTGKALLKEWASMGLAPGVLLTQAGAALTQSIGQSQIQGETFGGVESADNRQTKNYVASVGANLYDMIDDWFLFGMGDKLLGKTTGLTLPGLSGTDTQMLRGLYWSNHPDANQNKVSNTDLLEWIAANNTEVFPTEIRTAVKKAKELGDSLGITPAEYDIKEGKINKEYKEKSAIISREYGAQKNSLLDKSNVSIDAQLGNNMDVDPAIREQMQYANMSFDDRQKLTKAAELKKQKKAQLKKETDLKKKVVQANIDKQMTSIVQNMGRVTYGQSIRTFQGDDAARNYHKNVQPSISIAAAQSNGWKPSTMMLTDEGKKQEALKFLDVKGLFPDGTPKFAKGVDSAPGGQALVGEKGMEMMLHNGMASMIGTNGPEFRYVPKGAEIVPNHKLPKSMPAMADGTIGANAAMMTSNTKQIMELGKIIADAINNSTANNSGTQNINLVVDGRQLNNIQYRRQQNRMGTRPNDLV